MKHELPKHETSALTGMDTRPNLEAPVLLKPFQRSLVPTGLFIELQPGYKTQLRPRRDLAVKHGISDTDFEIKDGKRVAQMIISPRTQVNWESMQMLNETSRDAGGFGLTGHQ